MEKKYSMILSAEEAFAREVALGVHTTRPLTVWHYLIPGMFIIDFLRRGSSIRRYARHFLFPRKLALGIAVAALGGEEKEAALSRAEQEIRKWLESLGIYAEGLKKCQMEVVTLLIDSYQRLLMATGETYYSLIENAYGNRRAYETFLARLASAEDEVDRNLIENVRGGEGLSLRLSAEKEQVEKQRKKHTDKTFSWIG